MREVAEGTRRRFMKILGTTGAALSLSAGMGSAAAQEGVVQTFELLGERSGWVGVAPESIADTKNPTLELSEVGGTYRVEWENGDGLTHNFVILNDQGDVLARTDLVSSQGGTASVEFEATEEMSEYLCEPHPDAMNGEIVVGEQSNEYQDIKDNYDFGFETGSDGFIGITPSEIEGQTNPELTMTEGEEYDAALVYGVERDDLNLAFVDENDEVIASTGAVNDHGRQSDVTFEATTEITGYIAEAAPDTYRGSVTVEEAPGPSREEQIQQLREDADFVLDGLTPGWEGIAPSEIEGEVNPGITLEAGEEYTFGWINGDGQPHNIAIWDENDEPLHSTENVSEENATQTLTFEATTEAAQYICEVHPGTMAGDLTVEGGPTPTPTATATETETATATATEETDTETATEESETTSTDGPGFGGLTALAGVGAGVAAAARRFAGTSEDEE